MKKITSSKVLGWIRVGITLAIAGVLLYVSRSLFDWFRNTFRDNIPTVAAQGKTLAETQKAYVDAQAGAGAGVTTGITETINALRNSNLSPWEITKLYLSSLNIFKYF